MRLDAATTLLALAGVRPADGVEEEACGNERQRPAVLLNLFLGGGDEKPIRVIEGQARRVRRCGWQRKPFERWRNRVWKYRTRFAEPGSDVIARRQRSVQAAGAFLIPAQVQLLHGTLRPAMPAQPASLGICTKSEISSP